MNTPRIPVYALNCGAVQSRQSNGVSLALWKEHRTYHVRLHDHARGMRACWNRYDTLIEARAFYSQIERTQWSDKSC